MTVHFPDGTTLSVQGYGLLASVVIVAIVVLTTYDLLVAYWRIRSNGRRGDSDAAGREAQ
jgi:hypothetical protein